MEIQYESDTTLSGVVNTQGGPSTTPSYSSRPFAMGWNRDPSVLNVAHTSIVEAGGVMTNTSRNSPVLRIPKSPWLFSGTVGSYLAAGYDLRQTAFGNFAAAFVDASTTATATYGRLVIKYDLSFRFPMNLSLIGVQTITSLMKIPLLDTSKCIEQEQKSQKEDNKRDVKGWFL